MPANLPPQYYSLTGKLKEAKDTEEKISILEEMLAITPKHKGTEKLQKDIKAKIARLKKEAQSTRKTKKEQILTVKKEGAAQMVITGPPNSGKSTLLNALTNANAKVADYPFTTTIPQPAMMPYEDILIQLVDTPPLTKDFSPGWLKEIIKNADGILAVFDLSKDFEKKFEEFREIFKDLKIKDNKIIFVGNKIDLISGGTPSSIKSISALKETGLDDLKKEIFKFLEIVRVYSKEPNKETDFAHPFTLRKGGRLMDLAEEIHYEVASKFKYARLFKKDSRKPIIVGKDYILEDGDIIEIHS